MDLKLRGQVRVRVIDWHKPKPWWIVAYLIIPEPFNTHQYEQFIKQPSAQFETFVEKHVTAYLKEGVMPPEEIAMPIMNIADSFVANQQAEIRTGDYIALQTYMHKHAL